MRPPLALLVTITLASLAAPASAQQAPATPAPAAPAAPARADDEAAIRGLDQAFTKAFDAGDAGAVAATFTDDAEVVDEDGREADGREAIAALFAAAFQSNPGATIALRTDAPKFLGPDTALARGHATVTPAAATGGAAEHTRYTVVFVRRGGHWLQASVRDEPDPGAPHAERLKPLEWLVGDWVSESNEAVVQTSCAWSENKTFLVRSFTVRVEGKPAMTGEQRIGWDPLKRQVRDWVFDSDGGFAEGHWSHDGDHWVVKSEGVRSDGSPASSTQIITRVNKDMMRWHSVDRTVAGKAAPDIDEFVLVRKPPKPR